jgi:predicted RNA-binding protein
MVKKHSHILGAALVILSLAVIVGLMAPDLSAAATSVNGKIKTIDLAKRTVNVRLTDGSLVFLKVPLSASLTRNGRGVALSALTLRDSVTGKYDSITRTAANLKATGPAVTRSNGAVKRVRDAAGTVKVGLKNFKTSAITRIARNGHLIPLGRLTRHDSVVVHSKPSTTLANDIVGNGPDECDLEGTITAINLDQGTVTITPDNGTPDMVFYVDGSTTIEVDGVAVGLAALQVEMRAEVDYDPATLLAFSIQVDTEEDETDIEGTVTAVDLNAGTITIQRSWESAQCNNVVLIVTAATEITLNDLAATLADITVGISVKAYYHESTRIAISIAAGDGDDTEEGDADVEGTVTALGENSITITPEASVECTGEPVTLTVDGSTVIEIDGVAGLFSQIVVGNWACAEYDQVTLLAKEIKVNTGGGEAQAKKPAKK